MKKNFLTFTLLAVLSTTGLFAIDPPYARQNRGQGPNQPQPCASADCQHSQIGKRQGKKTGPQDGSGPIHQPGTGGGNGGGRRGGRR